MLTMGRTANAVPVPFLTYAFRLSLAMQAGLVRCILRC
ncbi:hypothetical protein XGA_0545 [Xanthomonas hortorum ATCC 19865]|nr:hypothetical protein XGA_0545 [Xanthomonas hortorum ATCC 19865]